MKDDPEKVIKALTERIDRLETTVVGLKTTVAMLRIMTVWNRMPKLTMLQRILRYAE